MNLVFLLEERSMKIVLDEILPQILPKDVYYQTIAHAGKTSLRKSIPHKLTGWNSPDTKFVIVQDQDANDCLILKKELKSICEQVKKEALIRIACHELEAWYFGDLQAVSKAYNIDLLRYARKQKYRVPDAIISPKAELKKLIPRHQQLNGARRIARYMDVNNNSSKSFQTFVDGVKKMCVK